MTYKDVGIKKVTGKVSYKTTIHNYYTLKYIKLKTNTREYILYVRHSLFRKIKRNNNYTFFICYVRGFLYGFETEFEATIFYNITDIKGLGVIKAMEIMRVFSSQHQIVKSLNYLQKVNLTDYHGINTKLSDRLQKKFLKLWEEGVLDD